MKSPQPFVVIVCGLTGSGKSTLARELGNRFALPVINSDVIRKQLAGQQNSQAVPFNTGIYSEAMTERTYAAMAAEAERLVANRVGAILDATFLSKPQREKIIALAKRERVPLFVIHCVLSKGTTKRRLRARQLAATDVSDGRWEIYLEQAAIEEPFTEFSTDAVLELDTDAPAGEIAGAAEAFLRSRLQTLSKLAMAKSGD